MKLITNEDLEEIEFQSQDESLPINEEITEENELEAELTLNNLEQRKVLLGSQYQKILNDVLTSVLSRAKLSGVNITQETVYGLQDLVTSTLNNNVLMTLLVLNGVTNMSDIMDENFVKLLINSVKFK